MNHQSDSVVAYAHGEDIAFQPTLDRLRRLVPFAQALVSTTLPRGGLQIIQLRNVDPAWIRTYGREHHLLDVMSWMAMLRGEPVSIAELVNVPSGAGRIASRFAAAALAPARLEHYVAAPLSQPLLEGYPGVLQVFRESGSPDFTSAEIRRLGEAAAELDEAMDRVRARRRGEAADQAHPLVHELRCRQIVIGGDGRLLFPSAQQTEIDEKLREGLMEAVEQRLALFSEDPGSNGRARLRAGPQIVQRGGGRRNNGSLTSIPQTRGGVLTVPAELGDQWTFRLALYEFFPALTLAAQEPVAVVSLPPECDAWALLRRTDIEADGELARLIPAIEYMHKHFFTGINLTEVARSVHLSPFHFHRRFTELLGTTPKHFLFDCQIAHAKRHLATGEMGLLDIAQSAGFAHQSHFTSRFRQATGLTPTRWRRLVAEKNRRQRKEPAQSR